MATQATYSPASGTPRSTSGYSSSDSHPTTYAGSGGVVGCVIVSANGDGAWTRFYWPRLLSLVSLNNARGGASGTGDAPSGARAEEWLQWDLADRVSFKEDAHNTRLAESLEQGLQEWYSNE